MDLVNPRYFEKSAGIFKRLFAFVIDLFVLNFVVVHPFSPILSRTSFEWLSASTYNQIISGIIAIICLLCLGYFVLMEACLKKTIGMIILNIEVAGKISILKAVARHLYLIPLFPFSLFIIIDPLYLIFKGIRLSEKLTKTNTVEYIRMV